MQSLPLFCSLQVNVNPLPGKTGLLKLRASRDVLEHEDADGAGLIRLLAAAVNGEGDPSSLIIHSPLERVKTCDGFKTQPGRRPADELHMSCPVTRKAGLPARNRGDWKVFG